MKNLILFFVILINFNCSAPDDDKEISIMNTVMIDGVKCYSYTDGVECKFIPVPEKHADNIARVEE